MVRLACVWFPLLLGSPLAQVAEGSGAFGRREGIRVGLSDAGAGTGLADCPQWDGGAEQQPMDATAGRLRCTPQGSDAQEVSFTVTSRALADQYADPSFSAIMDNRAELAEKLRLAGSVTRIGATASWRVAFSVPTLASGAFRVTLHLRVPNWRFFEQPAGRRIHSLVHNYANKRDSSWKETLSEEDRSALIVHNTLVFARGFHLKHAAGSRDRLPFCDAACPPHSSAGIMRGDIRSDLFWQGQDGGWQPPACNLRRFFDKSCESSCFSIIPKDTSIIFIADSNGQHMQAELKKLTKLPPVENHLVLPTQSTFQWRYFRGIGGDGISGFLMYAGLKHLYRDKPLQDLPLDLRLEMSAMKPAASLCKDTLMDDSLTSRLGRHVAFISAGLWPVIYKWQGYIESLAWGVRLAKEDCVRRGLPVTVFWVESMATNATSGKSNNGVSFEWRSTWDKRLEEQERLVRKILEPAVDIVPMHAITGSIDHHISADGHHQTGPVYQHVAEVLFNYALSAVKCVNRAGQ